MPPRLHTYPAATEARLTRLEQRDSLKTRLDALRDALGEADTPADKRAARDAVKAFKAAHAELQQERGQ